VTDRLILVGRVAGAFGVKGEIRIASYTDEPAALLRYRDLKQADGAPALTLTAGRPHKGALVARAKEVATREDAEGLRGLELFVPRDVLPPPDEDEFYLADLIGLMAVDAAGRALGGGVAATLPSKRMIARGSRPTFSAITSFDGGH